MHNIVGKVSKTLHIHAQLQNYDIKQIHIKSYIFWS